MRITLVARLLGLLIPLALATPDVARAATVCVRSGALGGWTFVLKKASVNPGDSGAAAGYAIRDDGLINAISGGYLVGNTTIFVGITRYGAGFSDTVAGASPTTTFHQLEASLRGNPGSDWPWTLHENGALTSTMGGADLVDCRTVPKIPKIF